MICWNLTPLADRSSLKSYNHAETRRFANSTSTIPVDTSRYTRLVVRSPFLKNDQTKPWSKRKQRQAEHQGPTRLQQQQKPQQSLLQTITGVQTEALLSMSQQCCDEKGQDLDPIHLEQGC